MGLRGPNDIIPEGERVFMLASTKKALMEADLPVKVRNLGSKKTTDGG
jgi:hypothetical protein